ncbi:MAG: DUF2007 domain-containing protein [Deltaproteobacteria bacterium]|nr:MAG: DUF2007 domain-containing protein [Deltaproteobacteria bacterium]
MMSYRNENIISEYNGYILLLSCSSEAELNIVVGLLENNGIKAKIKKTDSGIYPGIFSGRGAGFDIYVRKEDFKEAKYLLDTVQRESAEEIEKDSYEKGINMLETGERNINELSKTTKLPYKASFRSGLILGLFLGIVLMLGFYEGKKTRKDYPSTWDSNGDGNADIWIEYSKGQIVKQIYDQNFDGVADAWQYYRDGSQYRAESDENHNGKVDVWAYYDPPGERERIEFDNDHDSEVDHWEYYKKGERYKYKSDNDRNGIVDEWGTMKNGFIAERNWSFQNDKIVDKKTTYKNGRKISETYDRDRNGEFDELIILDEFERVVDVKKEGEF